MKRTFYILSAGFLGLLVATVLHGMIEMIALKVIFGQPERFADSFWWQEWSFLHSIASNTLWLLGLSIGFYLGYCWWEPHGKLPGFYHWRRFFK